MTLTPEHDMCEAEKLPFWAELRNGMTAEMQRSTTPKLVANLTLAVVSTTAHIISTVRGADITYTTGTRPLTRGRSLLNIVDTGFGVARIAVNARELMGRVQPSSTSAALSARTTSIEDLAGKLWTMSVPLIIGVREVARGKSTFRGYRYSRYGRVLKSAQLGAQCITVASAGYELHRRRDEWLPAFKDAAVDLKEKIVRQRRSLAWRLKDTLPSRRQSGDRFSEAELDMIMAAVMKNMRGQPDR